MERLITDYSPLVRRLCRRFHFSGEPLEDLVQIGTVGLLKASKKFDPERGSNFISFAVPVIVGEIKNYFRDHGWAVKVPRKLQMQKIAVQKTVEPLRQQLRRTPTVQEIAESTGLSEEEVYQTFEVEMKGKPLSLDAEYPRKGNEGVSTLLDYVGGEDPHFRSLVDRIDLTNALSHLNEREKTIIRLKFGASLSQTQIADLLGLSQMQISRLQRKALGKLKIILTGDDGANGGTEGPTRAAHSARMPGV